MCKFDKKLLYFLQPRSKACNLFLMPKSIDPCKYREKMDVVNHVVKNRGDWALAFLMSWCFFGMITVLGQETSASFDGLNRMDERGQRTGMWELRDNGGGVLEKGVYRKGQKHGVWEAYYPHGRMKHQLTYEDGQARGPARFYYEDVTLWEEGFWDVDKWVGEYRFYYPSGQMAYHWRYNTAGKREGEQLYYHENGQLKYRTPRTNGVIDGIERHYDEQGTLVKSTRFKNGVAQLTAGERSPVAALSDGVGQAVNEVTPFIGTGRHTVYHINGQIEKQGYFRDGILMDGRRYVYDAAGRLVMTQYYEDGKIVRSEVSEKGAAPLPASTESK